MMNAPFSLSVKLDWKTHKPICVAYVEESKRISQTSRYDGSRVDAPGWAPSASFERCEPTADGRVHADVVREGYLESLCFFPTNELPPGCVDGFLSREQFVEFCREAERGGEKVYEECLPAGYVPTWLRKPPGAR